MESHIRKKHKNITSPKHTLIRWVGWVPFGIIILLGWQLLPLAPPAQAQAQGKDSETVKFTVKPGECTGWENARQAAAIDLLGSSGRKDFSEKNSAVFYNQPGATEAATTETGEKDKKTADEKKGETKKSAEQQHTTTSDATLECSGFTWPKDIPNDQILEKGSIIFSLALDGYDANEDVVSLFAQTAEGTWEPLDSFPFLENTDNAKHGGFWTYPLPLKPEDVQKTLAHLKIKIEYDAIPTEKPTEALLDGVALTLEFKKPEKKSLEEAITLPAHGFELTQTPAVTVAGIEEESFWGKIGFPAEERTVEKIELQGPGTETVTPEYEYQETTVQGITSAEYELRTANFTVPGEYTLTLTVKENGQTQTITRDFSWGVLTININKATFAPNDKAYLQMGVLDGGGHTLCDAQLHLEITSPTGKVTTLSTDDKTIEYSGTCAGDTVVEVPDYFTHFDNGPDIGRFDLKLTATTANGEHEIKDFFEVEATPAFIVERTGPTRIYPLAPYTMKFTVTPSADFIGSVQESMPLDFEVTEHQDGIVTSNEATHTKTISWSVNWTKGKSYELAYTFDAPDISPELFLLGPLTLTGANSMNPNSASGGIPWKEGRQWQIASDALTGAGMLVYDEDGANNTTPHYRTWNATDLSGESQLQDDDDASDDTNHTIVESAPNRNEYIAARLIAAGEIDVQVFNGPTGAWIDGTNAPANGDFTTGIGTTNDVYRGFDVAYEAKTGDGIVVYEQSSTGDGILGYRTWDGAAWSNEGTVNYSAVDEGDDVAVWVECEADYDTDNILCAWREATNLGIYGARWDGSAWQDISAIDTANGISTRQDFDVAWEGTSGEGMVVYNEPASVNIDAATYTPGSGFADTSGITDGSSATQWVTIAGSPNNDYIAVMFQDTSSTNNADINIEMWNGSDWTTVGVPSADTDINNNGYAQGQDVEWEYGGGDRALFVWRDGSLAETSLVYMVYDVSAGEFQAIDDGGTVCNLTEGGAGTTEQVTDLAAAEDSGGPCRVLGAWATSVSGIDLEPDPSSDKIFVNAENLTAALVPESQHWNGDANGTWLAQTATMGAWEADLSTGATLSASLPTKPYDFAYRASYEANVNVTGTQTTPITIGATNTHVGGAFTINQSRTTENITSIKITEQGTVNASTNLDNILLRYDLDTTAPYNCSSETFAGGETQFGSTDTDGFDAANGSSTFSGSTVAVTPTQSMCIYVIMDIGSGAADGETLEIEITNPSTDVLVSTGGIGPTFDREIAGTTTLSAPSITVSGGCFTNAGEGTPCSDDGSDEIKVAVNGVEQTNGDATVDDSWTFTIPQPASGATMVFFRKGEATASEEATTVTKYDGDGGNVTVVKMYESQLVIGTDTGSTNSDQTVSIADMDTTSNGYENSDDENVLFDVTAGSDLTVDQDGDKSETLYVIAGDTYRPASGGGGDTTTLHLYFEGTFTTDNNAVNVTGNFTNAGTFTASTSTITFNSTTAAQDFITNAAAYSAITINNTGGAGATDDIDVSGALDINGTFTITDGDLDLAVNDPNVTTAGAVAIGASGLVTKPDTGSPTWTFDGTSQNWSDASSGQDIGLVSINGGPTTVTLTSSVRATKVDVTASDTLALGSSGYTLTLTGSGQGAAQPFIVSGTLTEGTNSTVDYIGTAASDVERESYWNLSVRPGGAVTFHAEGGGTLTVLGNLVVGDGATAGIFNLDTNDPTFDVDGNVTIAATGTLVASATGTFTVGGNWDNNATFTSSGGTVTLDAADTDNTVECGSSSFNSVTFAGSDGSGTWTVQTDNCTVAATLNVDTSDILTITTVTLTHSGVTFTLGGTISGTGTLRIMDTSDGPGTGGTLSSVVRYDATTASIAAATVDARTYGGAVQMYSNSADPRTITLPGGTMDFDGALSIEAAGAGTLELTGATSDPAYDLEGNFSMVSGGGVETFTTGGGNWNAAGSVNLTNGTYTTEGTHTLIMDGAGTLTSDNETLRNLTINSGSTVILAAATHTVTGDLSLGGAGTPDVTGSTILMSGSANTIVGGSKTLNNLTIDGGGTITHQTSDLTVSGTLNVTAGDILTITSVTLTHSGTTLTLSGTISGSGTLRIMDTSSGPGSGGTLSSGVRYDASTASIANTTFDARTYGGAVELYANSGSAKSITAAAGGYTFSSTLTTTAGGAGVVTGDLSAATGTTTVTGALAIGATTIFSAPAALSLSGNYTNSGTFTDNSGIVTAAGGSQQTFAGTMTSSSDFNNLTITNNSGADPDASPSVIFSASATTAGTFTAITANTKLRFLAGGTYTFQNISFNGQQITSRVALRSSSAGTDWNLNVAGTRSVYNTDVKDSDACGQSPNIDGTAASNINSTGNFCWDFASLTFIISDTTVGFGDLTPANVRYATGDLNGTTTFGTAAHTLSVYSSAAGGYSITYTGATLTNAALDTIDVADINNDNNGTPGSEQFAFGVTTAGDGTIVGDYDANSPADYKFVAGAITPFFSEAGITVTEVLSVFYIANIGATTELGEYSTDVTYIVTGTF